MSETTSDGEQRCLTGRLRSTALLGSALVMLAFAGNCGVRLVQAYNAHSEWEEQIDISVGSSVAAAFDGTLNRGQNYDTLRAYSDEASRRADAADELVGLRLRQAVMPWYRGE